MPSRLPVALALATLLPLTGCVSVRVHRVPKTIVASNVLDSTLEQLVAHMDTQFQAISSIQASVEIAASTGGEHEGEVKEIPTFSGYIFLRKPQDLRVLLQLPFVRSRALDMVSDGKTFKLLVPPKNLAITGDDIDAASPAPPQPVAAPAPGAPALVKRPSGLESIRPNIIREALLIPALAPGEFVTRTEHGRLLPPDVNRKEMMEEPDYDVTVLRLSTLKTVTPTAEIVRVIHIGRIDLRPFQQDIYDHTGRVVTTVTYGNYASAPTATGTLDFPRHIVVTRPIDEYTLKIDFTKLQLNPTLDDEQFLLNFPGNIPVKKM